MLFEMPVRNAPSAETEYSSVALPKDFQITVLGAHEVTIACTLQQLVGRRLIVRLSAVVPTSACIRIDCDDALLLGEVLGCWRQSSLIFAAVELQQAVTGFAKLRSVFDNFGHGPDVQEVVQRLRA